jgi:TonB family protein
MLLLMTLLSISAIFGGDSREATLPRIMALAVYAPRPKIPLSMRKRGLNAYGVFVMYVDPATGIVRRVETEKSTGVPALDESCFEAFGRWRFRPGSARKVRCPIRFVRPSGPNGSNQSLESTAGRCSKKVES